MKTIASLPEIVSIEPLCGSDAKFQVRVELRSYDGETVICYAAPKDLDSYADLRRHILTITGRWLQIPAQDRGGRQALEAWGQLIGNRMLAPRRNSTGEGNPGWFS